MKIFKYFLVLTTFFISSVSFAGTLVINSNQSDPRANEVGVAWYQERNGKIWWAMGLGGNSLSTVQ